MKSILGFLAQRPVFTRKELVEFLAAQGTTKLNTQRATIQYHIKQGHMVRIKQGLFASIAFGASVNDYPIDPYSIAGKSTPDATLAYHTALEYHGLAYTVFNSFTFCTNMRLRPFSFQNRLFEAVPFPRALQETKNELFATENVLHQGLAVKITTLERTFVDLLDQPNRSGGWEEIFRSIESIMVMNLGLVIEYALMLKKATTIAKVGYFLEIMRDNLGITESQLKILEKQLPKRPHYLDRSQRKGGIFVKRWNLIVPEKVAEQQWKEPSYGN